MSSRALEVYVFVGQKKHQLMCQVILEVDIFLYL